MRWTLLFALALAACMTDPKPGQTITVDCRGPADTVSYNDSTRQTTYSKWCEVDGDPKPPAPR